MYQQASTTPLIDGMSRDQVLTQYRNRVVHTARRMACRLPEHSELTVEDLVSYGSMGLLEACDRYQESRGVGFATFADFRIRGAMLDALRSLDAFSRYRRQASNRLADAQEQLTKQLGRPPKAQEVAEHMGLSLKDYWRAVDNAASVSVSSLDATTDDGGEGGLLHDFVPNNASPDALSELLDSEERQLLEAAIGNLPERKRQILTLYYVKNLTLQEIGQVFGLTHSRISQILSQTRRELRQTVQANTTPLRKCA